MPELQADVHGAGRRGLLDDRPPARSDAGRPARIAAALRRPATTVLVVDDDPTGSQVVAGVPLVTSWSPEDLRWALAHEAGVAFVLTNSRALSEAEAEAANRAVGERAQRVAASLGIRLEVISRSDSLLRGHFPAEVLALDEGLRRGGAAPLDGILLCPAYPEAGRITVDRRHWVRQGDGRHQPAAATEFAADPVFAYDDSDLRAWATARGRGRWRSADVREIGLDDLRRGGPERVAAILGRVSGGRPVVCDAADEEDLLVLAEGLARAEAGGRRFVTRSGPSFVAARSGRTVPPPCTGPIGEPGVAAGTLVVVGSHTALTSEQLARAQRRTGLRVLELDTVAVASSDNAARREVHQLAARAGRALRTGDVAIATARTLLTRRDPQADIRLKQRIAQAVVDVVRETVAATRPRAVVAKGGVTAHRVAAESLGARRATVLGQLLPGQVSVWRIESAAAAGLPYVVFPGNVGHADALTAVLTRTKDRT